MRTEKDEIFLDNGFEFIFHYKVTNASSNGKCRDLIIYLYLQPQCNDVEREIG